MHLIWTRFSIQLSVLTSLSLPSYKGATLRGGFGHALKKIACVHAHTKTVCDSCQHPDCCVYGYLFETPPPNDTTMMRKYTAVPHPFILEPPLIKKSLFHPTDTITFGLILIGKAIGYLPYFIYAFEELGKRGLGRDGGRFEVKSVHGGDQNEQVIYRGEEKVLKNTVAQISAQDFFNRENPFSETVTLRFLTPARIVYEDQLSKTVPFHLIFRTLIRRLSLLSYFHSGGDSSEVDFKGLIKKAESVQVVVSDLKWYDWERYSGRQQTRMKMGGWIGEVTYRGDFSELYPYLLMGVDLHVGKGTSFGLGQYEIVK